MAVRDNNQLKESLSIVNCAEGNPATCSEHVSINMPVDCASSHVELVQEQTQHTTNCQPETVTSIVEQTDIVASEHSVSNSSALCVPKESPQTTVAENSSILSQCSSFPPASERDVVHNHTPVTQPSSVDNMFSVQTEGKAVPNIPEVVVQQKVHEAKDRIAATSAIGTKS